MRQRLLFSIIVMGMVCGCALAAGGTLPGAGAEANPYLIEDLADFDAFANPANAATYWAAGVHTKLMTNIDLSGRTYTTAVIAPDTDNLTDDFQGTIFFGVLDGNSHTIYNLTISAPDEDYIGLFGYLGGPSQIENIGLENANVMGRSYVGGLGGYGSACIINVCYVTGSIEGTGDYFAGGLLGRTNSSLLTSCYASGSVSGNSFVGGLIGDNYSCKIYVCHATNAINGVSYVGGLVGRNMGLSAIINTCYSTGAVDATGSDFGGLIGQNANYPGAIYACFWDIETSGQTNSSYGGEGKTTDEMKNIVTYLEANWSFASGPATHGDWVMPDNGYPKLLQEVYTPISLPSLKGLTEEQAGNMLQGMDLLIGENYSIYDTSVSAGLISRTFPKSNTIVYAEISKIHLLSAKQAKYSGGDGINTPYQIECLDDFFDLMSNPADWDKSFVLNANIDLDGLYFKESPIAPLQSTSLFTGIFDGRDHVISNLNIASNGINNIGLFGYINTGAHIMNLGVENINIAGGIDVGGLAGNSYQGTFSSCYSTGIVNGIYKVGGLVGYSRYDTFTSCYVTSSIYGARYVGGLIGDNTYGSGILTSCHATGSVEGRGNYVGGLVGESSSSITFCYATGPVKGEGTVGGLAGSIDPQLSGQYNPLTSCYATGEVVGSSNVGGLIGVSDSYIISDSYAVGNVLGTGFFIGGLVGQCAGGGSMTSCYATGGVTGNSGIGGLVGLNVKSYNEIVNCYALGKVSGNTNIGGLLGDIIQYPTINACFWDTDSSGASKGIGIIDPDPVGVTGKTTSEMMTQSTFTGWDFTTPVWVMLREGEDYPRLAWQAVFDGDIAGLYGVDMVDFARLASWWNEPVCDESNQWCQGADIDHADGVDIKDLSAVAEDWLK